MLSVLGFLLGIGLGRLTVWAWRAWARRSRPADRVSGQWLRDDKYPRIGGDR